jgi:lysophospholipase L1-like esterase
MKRHVFIVAGIVAACLAAAEAFARFELGLGDPPLIVRDPNIDYLFAPSKTYHRFGNKISYNAFSMRSDEVTLKKKDPHELRVLVMGDSVINGGGLTDDAELATRLAQNRLARELRRRVWIGNVSAGSWGPGNLLAYARRYGWFDADVVLLVLSSHDISDIPEFQPELGPSFPQKTPWFALQEAATRYLPLYAGNWLPSDLSKSLGPAAAEPQPPTQNELEEGRRLLAELLEYAKLSVPMVAALHHFEQSELKDDLSNAGKVIEHDIRKAEVLLLRTKHYLQDESDSREVYRDNIHINAAGQQLYAEAIVCVVRVLLASKDIAVCDAASHRSANIWQQ